MGEHKVKRQQRWDNAGGGCLVVGRYKEPTVQSWGDPGSATDLGMVTQSPSESQFLY